MKKSIKAIILSLMAITFVLLGSVSVFAEVEADSEDFTNQYPDRGYLLISPSKLKYGLLEPGNSYTETFEAYNIGGKTLTFKLSAEPFGVEDKTYEPIFSEATNRTKVADWVSFPDGTEYTIEPQESTSIRVRVKVPKDAIGGGQYAAIMATIVNKSDNDSSQIQAQSRVALQLYSTVNGDLTYQGELSSRSVSGFSFEPVIKSSSTIKNTGNADFEAKYALTIKSAWNGEIEYEDTQDKVVMPETTRIFAQNWEEAPRIGVYNVTQEITYVNQNGEQVVESHESLAIICPAWLILIVLVIIALIITSVVLSNKKRKQKK